MRSFAAPVLVSILVALTAAQQDNDLGDLTNIDPSLQASISNAVASLSLDPAITSDPGAYASSVFDDLGSNLPPGLRSSASAALESLSDRLSDITNTAQATDGPTATGGGSSDSEETSGAMSGDENLSNGDSEGGQSEGGDNGNAGARPSAALGLCGAAVVGVLGAAVML